MDNINIEGNITNENSQNSNTPNYNSDYDDVFKSMKCNNTNLFIPVINESFGRNYSVYDRITILPSEGDITKISDGKADIDSRTSDFLLKIHDEIYLLECQSYNDGSMAIRIAEYAFISAKQNAVCENGHVIFEMPHYCIIYIKSNNATPEYTRITYKFPDGTLVDYDSKNVILNTYTKEEILKKRLYPYIPYYILRYESDIKSEKIALDFVETELQYLLNGLEEAVRLRYIDALAFNNIKAFTNKVIEHFTNGRTMERLVNIMGGKIITTEADKIHQDGVNKGRIEGRMEGRIEQYIETSKEYGATNEQIINGLINKFNLSTEEATNKINRI